MLEKTILGNTSISVSRIGLGTVKLGRNQKINYPEAFALPTDQECLTLFATAKELGINLLDTAPAYGTSEERLGKLLKNQRHDWVLCTKVGEEFVDGESHFDFSPTAVQFSIERSLKRLHTDYLDIVLVHSNGHDEQIIQETAIFSTLEKLKASGHIRAFGMSTKSVAGGMLTVDFADVVMVTYNPTYTDEQSVIAYAKANNKGVFIKKALASGHLQKIKGHDPVQTAMDFIFKEPGVSSVIVGTLNGEHLVHNTRCVVSAVSGAKIL